MKKLQEEFRLIYQEEDGLIKQQTTSRIYFEDGSFEDRVHTTVISPGKEIRTVP